jgi:C4-dicarboxylate-specific signal transduction histidine kinase
MSDNAANAFVFADHLKLDDSPTRDFYRVLLQGLVHKNNNVFGVIQGFSSLILMESQLDSGVKENVEQMKESSISASDLAKTILTSAGCSRVKPEPTALGDFLPWIESNARELCDNHGVELVFNGGTDLPKVSVDSTRINELFGGLIKNAAEAAAGPPGGKVAIDLLEVSTDENRVDLFIRNTTLKDFSPEELLKLYEPFHTTKDASVHAGLGLTTAGILAGQMGMRLGLRSADNTMTAWLSMPTV